MLMESTPQSYRLSALIFVLPVAIIFAVSQTRGNMNLPHDLSYWLKTVSLVFATALWVIGGISLKYPHAIKQKISFGDLVNPFEDKEFRTFTRRDWTSTAILALNSFLLVKFAMDIGPK